LFNSIMQIYEKEKGGTKAPPFLVE